MEGLEISEIKYSQIEEENRYDSEYFQKKYIQCENHLKRKKHKRITEKFKVTDGEHGSVAFQENGVKYLTAENIKKGYVDISKIRYVSKDVDIRNARASVVVGDILISIKGTLGEIAIAEEWLLPANMNRDVAILKPITNEVPSEYVALFLMSNYGSLQSMRGGSGGVQQMITLERLRKFIVPSFAKTFYDRISVLFKESQRLRISSQNIYNQAESFLIETIGLNNFQPSTEPVNVKSLKDSFGSTGRLDAEYYQKKYEIILNYITNFKLGYTTISNEFSLSKETIDKTKVIYNYTEISDIDVSNGSVSYNKILIEDLPDNGKMLLKEGQLIISKVRPYRGAIGIIRDCPENYVGSGAFTILSEKRDYKKEVVQTLLRTMPYQELIMKYNVGSSYPVVKDEDILNLPIPFLESKTQMKIADLVEESYTLKKQSEQLLEIAKRTVEIAIEKNEIEALKYIENANN